jgi:hypothetical protein
VWHHSAPAGLVRYTDEAERHAIVTLGTWIMFVLGDEVLVALKARCRYDSGLRSRGPASDVVVRPARLTVRCSTELFQFLSGARVACTTRKVLPAYENLGQSADSQTRALDVADKTASASVACRWR